MKSAIQGELGGNGAKCFLASATASVSKPAKTVVKWSGFLSPVNTCEYYKLKEIAENWIKNGFNNDVAIKAGDGLW